MEKDNEQKKTKKLQTQKLKMRKTVTIKEIEEMQRYHQNSTSIKCIMHTVL